MTISIRVSPQEEALFRAYAKSNNMSVSEMLRQYAKDRIEEEIDLKECMEYLMQKENGTLVTYPADEVFKELGL